MVTTRQAKYQAYMLRLWQVRDETGATWRASLENPHSGERLGFTSLDKLFEFLKKRVVELKFEEMDGLDE